MSEKVRDPTARVKRKNGMMPKPIGRPKGAINKTTVEVREAIAQVLKMNVENFGTWLTLVAEGQKAKVFARDGVTKIEVWLNKPDPAKALDLALNMAEYHIPKLARQELAVSGKIENTFPTSFVEAMRIEVGGSASQQH